MHRRHGPFGNFDFSLSLLTERLGYSSSKWRRYIWEEMYLFISYLPSSSGKQMALVFSSISPFRHFAISPFRVLNTPLLEHPDNYFLSNILYRTKVSRITALSHYSVKCASPRTPIKQTH